MSDWLATLKNAKKSCITHNNFRKVHYDFGKGKEMVEEYNMDTSCLTRRAWRVKTGLGEGQWNIEVGDPEPEPVRIENMVIKENSSQPHLTKRITKRSIEWRIRNLSYPIGTYTVTADQTEKCLIVRTTNKKYFKKIFIPELERVNLLPDQKKLEFSHKFSTLVITYKKPQEVVDMEKSIFEEVKKLKARGDGDMDCKPS